MVVPMIPPVYLKRPNDWSSAASEASPLQRRVRWPLCTVRALGLQNSPGAWVTKADWVEEAGMPWNERSPMTERLRFVADCLTELYGIAELAEQYGISRKTAYKWARRFVEEGMDGLRDRAPVADHVANRTPSETERLVVELRGEHVTWGPKKLLAVLERHGLKATFAVPAVTAEIDPARIKALVARGHEVAAHGFKHEDVSALSREQEKERLARFSASLEQLNSQLSKLGT